MYTHTYTTSTPRINKAHSLKRKIATMAGVSMGAWLVLSAALFAVNNFLFSGALVSCAVCHRTV
jgi:predicted alpha/beta superfamily hydrolase